MHILSIPHKQMVIIAEVFLDVTILLKWHSVVQMKATWQIADFVYYKFVTFLEVIRI